MAFAAHDSYAPLSLSDQATLMATVASLNNRLHTAAQNSGKQLKSSAAIGCHNGRSESLTESQLSQASTISNHSSSFKRAFQYQDPWNPQSAKRQHTSAQIPLSALDVVGIFQKHLQKGVQEAADQPGFIESLQVANKHSAHGESPSTAPTQQGSLTALITCSICKCEMPNMQALAGHQILIHGVGLKTPTEESRSALHSLRRTETSSGSSELLPSIQDLFRRESLSKEHMEAAQNLARTTMASSSGRSTLQAGAISPTSPLSPRVLPSPGTAFLRPHLSNHQSSAKLSKDKITELKILQSLDNRASGKQNGKSIPLLSQLSVESVNLLSPRPSIMPGSMLGRKGSPPAELAAAAELWLAKQTQICPPLQLQREDSTSSLTQDENLNRNLDLHCGLDLTLHL